MTDLDEIQNRFTQRLNAVNRRRISAQTRPLLNPQAPFAEQMSIYDSWLESRLALWRGETPAAAAQPLPASSPVTMHAQVETWAGEADQAALDEFDLHRFPLPGGFNGPTRLLAHPDAFLRALAEGLELTHAERRDFLAHPPQAAEALQAVYLPGAHGGCLVNAARFVGLEQPNPQAHLDQHRDARVDALGAVVRARWGSGFLLEYTTLGREMQQHGLYTAWAARQAGLRLPRLQPALARLDALGRGMSITWHGWREWIWEYLACKMRQPLGEGLVVSRPSSRRVGEILTRVARLLPFSLTFNNFTIRVTEVADLFRFLFFQQSRLASQAVNQLLLAAEEYCNQHDEDNHRQSGMRVRSLLGWYYLSDLEAAISSYCVPYALLIALHTPPGLAEAEPEEIRRRFQEDPQSVSNTRLSLLSGLNPSVRYNPKALRLAARELKLDAPKEYLA
ncbi:hypothetical protein [Levilinea saccharolytica]|uniref:Uncharacterized protein n=1 Tax=Levilinea saccharolytica TaxID=229921 RepID=A0A0P6YLL0_9CHLR|nr:hypothetical protein [Levilinea saccharolytica]KPL83541.1 hypothetical protein ADN01_08095 [Levilinea saccharolytica]GAP18546.1 hypothetical protein LSAC_02442 [Levilinea saccharolytica]